MAVQLGDIVRDKITGYKGVAIGLTDWLHGCRRVTIQAQDMKDGKPLDSYTIDEPQCEVVQAAKPHEPVKTGGPGPAPARRADVKR